MKSIYLLSYILLCAFLCTTCKQKEPAQPELPLETCKIIPDSINIQMKWGEADTIKTDKGNLIVRFKEFQETCIFYCFGCEGVGRVYLELEMLKDMRTLPRIEVGRCGTPPIIEDYPFNLFYVPLCRYPIPNDGSRIFAISSGNLIFSVREISPYPKTQALVLKLLEEKGYCLDLIIKNKCL
jgi:hypothetical protein